MLKSTFSQFIFPQLTKHSLLATKTSPLFLHQTLSFNFSRNNRNNKNNKNSGLVPAPASAKLTKHDVEYHTNGMRIEAVINNRFISYDLGKVVKGATLGDTNRLILMCTCNTCGHKIIKTFTKKAYRNGAVVVFCDNCENRHLIADNIGWFTERPMNIEDFAEERGDVMLKIFNHGQLDHMLENLEFVGVKHTATMQSDRFELSSKSVLQMIENTAPAEEVNQGMMRGGSRNQK